MRTESRTDSRLFGELLRSLLKDGISARFQAHGRSMFPAIANGDVVQVDAGAVVQRDGVALVETTDGFRAHRVVRGGNEVVTRGDCCFDEDPHVTGVIGAVSSQGQPIAANRLGAAVRRWIARWRGHF